MRGTPRNWPLLKAEFCEGILGEGGVRTFPDLRTLAKRHGINAAYVRHVAGEQRWSDAKRQLAEVIDTQRMELHAGRIAVQAVALDAATQQVAAELLLVVRARIADLQATTKRTPATDLSLARLAAALRVVQLIAVGAHEGDEIVNPALSIEQPKRIIVRYERQSIEGTPDDPPNTVDDAPAAIN